MITKPAAKLSRPSLVGKQIHNLQELGARQLSRRSLVGKQIHNLQEHGARELAAVNLATWEERMSARAGALAAGRFPPDKLGDAIDPYNEMIRVHRGRIAHTFDSRCKCACGVQEHDEEERRMRAGNYVWTCRRCGISWREY
jgi:hypothetical protein